MIRFATIGTNFVAVWFAEAARRVESLHYSVVYSRTEETAKRFAAEHGAERICTDLNQLADDPDVDAVYISSPNCCHYEQAALMLSHGKHVLCEKTITSNLQELEHLISIAKENGVVLMEAMRSVHEPGFAAIKDYLPRLGTIRRVSFQYGKYSSRYDKFRAGIIENAFKPELSNGALMDIGVYCVHPLVRLFGLPDHIQTDCIKLSNGVDGAGTILASYPGMQAELLYSKISDNYLPSQIQGEEGTIIIDQISHPCRMTIYDRKGNPSVVEAGDQNDTLYDETKEWARLIENGESGEEHLAYTIMELKVMDEARRQMGIVFPADLKKL